MKFLSYLKVIGSLSLGVLWLPAATGGALRAQAPGVCTVEIIAGGGASVPGVGGPAAAAELLEPRVPRIGPDGLLYFADSGHHVIRRVTADGVIETFAGTGERGFSGDGGPAAEAKLSLPRGLAFGPDGSLFFFDEGNRRIRRISADGRITNYAGNGEVVAASEGFAGEGLPAVTVPLTVPLELAIGPNGVVYLTAAIFHRILQVTPDGILTTFAGAAESIRDRGYAGDGGPAAEALLNRPSDVAADDVGAVFIADTENRVIRRVGPDGVIETIVPRALSLGRIRNIDIGANQALYWSANGRLFRMNAEGERETVFDDAVSVQISRFSAESNGAVYIPRDSQIQVLAPGEETFQAIAGVGRTARRGDGGPALEAHLGSPAALSVGPGGEIYLVDELFDRVRVIRPGGAIEAFAGTGDRSFSADGGLAVETDLFRPRDVAVDNAGNVYISDMGSGRIRLVDGAGLISTYAGNGATSCASSAAGGVSRWCGDGGPAVEAGIPRPTQIEFDAQGNLYVIDNNSQRRPRQWLRKITSDGIAESVGTLILDLSANPATAHAIAADPAGGLLVYAREGLNQLYFLFDTLLSGGTAEYVNGFLDFNNHMTFGPDGHLYVIANDGVRRATKDGQVNLLIGRQSGPNFELAPIVMETTWRAAGLAFDSEGNLYFSDRNNRLVYRLNRATECELVRRPEIAVRGVRHGATFLSSSRAPNITQVSPGEILSIFGRRLGPTALAGAQVGPNGRLTTRVGGARVLVNGVEAPLIFSLDGQVGAILPYETPLTFFRDEDGDFVQLLAGRLRVELNGVLSESFPITVVRSQPGIFTLDSSGSGPAAALNQDGTLNGPENRAAPGSIIVFWATGEGLTAPQGVDGLIASAVFPKPRLPVEVTINSQVAEVLYAGAAPGLTAGAMQVNVRLPADLSLSPSRNGTVGVELKVGDQTSPAGVTVFVSE